MSILFYCLLLQHGVFKVLTPTLVKKPKTQILIFHKNEFNDFNKMRKKIAMGVLYDFVYNHPSKVCPHLFLYKKLRILQTIFQTTNLILAKFAQKMLLCYSHKKQILHA